MTNQTKEVGALPHPSGDSKACLTCKRDIPRLRRHFPSVWKDLKYCGPKCLPGLYPGVQDAVISYIAGAMSTTRSAVHTTIRSLR